MAVSSCLARSRTRLASLLYYAPWSPSTAIAPRLDPNKPIEEEQSPYYRHDFFHPTRLWDILNSRYQIVAKLGHGSGSTVWLARDLRRFRWTEEKFVVVKIGANRQASLGHGVKDELAILRRLTDGNRQHMGWNFVRKLRDSFTLGSPNAEHRCIVSEPLREPLWMYCQRFVGNVIPPNVVKVLIRMILEGLDYLHSQCQVIHTDLKTDNIMIRFEDPAIPAEVADDEYHHPLPQKHLDDGRVIYLSRNGFGPLREPTGMICITDFDRAVLGTEAHSGCIQADIYRAPESILDAGFSYPADIWNLGVMLWDLLEGDWLFQVATKGTHEYDDSLHIAHITALLGPKPDTFPAGQRTAMFYNPNGNLKHPELVPQDFSFESAITCMEGEEKRLCIEFVKRMLKWLPQERSTAKELLHDPWLHTGGP
ncbi:protein kinase [Sphaerulina musiva SO2202]|uniref:non-specific serine/threonine protein kinase n=1 Tax=Sphaerulina musiva (strain SO2202) TaxID=692275 RepID=N1QH19_SPHMS|nr:protein kinase [Sphaerulina musiva SO2202]EMF09309.1 protein kinase [Sphaerulina musiva SO2202]